IKSTPRFWGLQYITLSDWLFSINEEALATLQPCSDQRPSSSAQNRSPGIGPAQAATQGGSVSPPRVSQSAEAARSSRGGSVNTLATLSAASGANSQTWNVRWAEPSGTVSSLGEAAAGTSAGSAIAARRSNDDSDRWYGPRAYLQKP